MELGGNLGKQSGSKNVTSDAVNFLIEQQLLNQKRDGDTLVKMASTSGDNDISRRQFAHVLDGTTVASSLSCDGAPYDRFFISGAHTTNTFCSASKTGGAFTSSGNLAQCQVLHDACNAPGHGVANNAPTVSNAPADVTVTEDTASNLDLSAVVFADSDGDSLTVTLAASAGTMAASSGGGVTVGGSGTGSLTLAGTAANINTFLDTSSNIQYTSASNASGNDAATLTVTPNDGTVNGTAATINIDITAVNDEPTLTATGSNPSFTEGGSAASLFSGSSVSTIESGQTLSGFTLTVTNLADGASEILNADGTAIALTNGNSGTTATNSLSYSVSVAGSTATITFSGGTLSTAAIQTLVNALSYQNNSNDPNTANRVVTLISLTDSGSNAGSNDNVAALAVASTVTVTALNDEPTLTATGSNPSFTEGGSAASLFSGSSVSTIESGQTISGFTLTVGNVADGSNEILNADGTAITLTNGTSGTTATNSLSYSVSVSGSTATLTFGGGTVSAAATQTLMDALSYQNDSNNPDTTNRVVTLTSLTDSGSNAGSNDNVAAFSIASTVAIASIDDDGDLTAGSGVSEPVNLSYSKDTVGEAVNLFDFNLTDGGTSDGLAMGVSSVVLKVSGTASDTERNKITWRLNGNDAVNVVGTYNAGSDTITFAALSISIADGASEIYTVNGYYNDNTGLTNGNTIILALDGDTDVTIGASGTQMGVTSAINNGSGTVITDDISPVVTSVSVPANSTYAASSNLDFTVNFDENVTVNIGGGIPRLSLTIGATGRFADYIAGSGTSALVFREVVIAGDQDLDGISLGATVDPNSGTLRDSSGNNINTTLNSVGSLASVLVEALAPTVAEVTPVSTPGNDSTPDVTFSTNEAGTLAVGGSCGSADEGAVSSGNNTITLTQPDNSTPLTAGTYNDCTVTVTDSIGNVSNVPTLSSFVVDLTAPMVAEVTPVVTPSNDSTPDVTFSTTEAGTLAVGGSCGSASEGAISAGNSTITLTQTDNSTPLAAGTYADCTVIVTDSVGNANTAVTLTSFTVDIAAPTLAEVTPVTTPSNDSAPNVTFSTNEAGTLAVGGSCGSTNEGAISSGNNTITLTQTDNSTALAAGTYADCTLIVTDGVGNASSSLTLASFIIDLAAPTVAEVTPVVTPSNDSTPDVTFSTTEAGTLVVGGSCGSTSEGAISSGNNTITLTQTDNSTAIAAGTYADCTIIVTDSAGNANAPVTLSSFTVDLAASTVSSVTVPANATYIAGQYLDFIVNFDEAISVNTAGGTPQLNITVGSTMRQAEYISGSGNSALLFRYMVQSGDNDSDGIAIGSLAVNGGTLKDGAGNDATLTLNNAGATTAVLVDALASTISSVSIPNTAHKVGDVVTATITVSADADDYTTGSGGISGTIAGYALSHLSKTNNTTYTATFTITDGGTDVAAGSTIPVNFILTDSIRNTGSAYTTAINQNADAVYANLPDVDLTASSNAIAEDGGSATLTATLSGSLNNQWPIDITVNLAYSGSATIATDYTKSDSITISSGSSVGTSTVTAVADSLYDAAIAETIIVDISSVSVGNEGSTNQQTMSIIDAESAPTVSLSVGSSSIIETGGASTITASLSHPSYENDTVNLGYSGTATSGVDYGVPSASIVVAAGSTTANATIGINSIDDANSEDSETIIIDITSVTGGGATENAVQEQTITLTDDDNVAPVITSTAVTTIDEDALYSYTFTVTDANTGDTLTLSAPTLPAWLSFAANTGVLSGTPDNDDIGPHVVKLRVNDGTIDVDQDFTITVANTNDAPTLTGTPITTAVEGVAYSFTVIGADVDVGASLNYQLSNQPTWLSVNGSGVVSGTPTNSDVGTAFNIVISVSDGTETTELPAFNIIVDADMDGDGIGNSVDTDIDGDGMSNDFETANGLDPLDDSDADGDLDGDGISNLDEFINNTDPTADDYGPIISLDSNVVIDAVALLTDLPDGLASAVDVLDGEDVEVVVTHDLSSELLKPGRYSINWTAEDAAGNVTTETQTLDVRPIANWQIDQEASEGNTVTVSLYLNGDAPEYPVIADYTVSGTAINPEDHDAISGSLTITEGRRGSITLNIVSDAYLESDETVIFELDSITHAVAGVKQEHTVTIGELNHPPAVALSAALDSAPAKKLNVFSTTDGMVTITATVSDVDTGDSHTFEWLGGNKLNGTVSGNTYSFDPATAGKGVYQLTVKASDDASNPKSGSAVITLTVLSESLVLSNTTDSDSDGIDDLTEGFGDVDEDNVPDFADDIEAPNVLAMYPIGGASTDGAWFVETQAGLSLKLNLYSRGSAKYSPLLNAQQLVDENDRDRSDGGYIYDGGIFDFVVSNMPVPGQRVLVVIPQLQAIPENPVYRKLIDNTWSEYVVDANNTLQSAPGKLGVCPPPGSDEYTDGLTEGNFCVQLGIEDGGMNDADGEADGTIIDPGGVGEGIPVSVRTSGGAMPWPLLLLLSCLVLILRRRPTSALREGL